VAIPCLYLVRPQSLANHTPTITIYSHHHYTHHHLCKPQPSSTSASHNHPITENHQQLPDLVAVVESCGDTVVMDSCGDTVVLAVDLCVNNGRGSLYGQQ
nr:hypothetical protein [Tanacetum cinerariifolium]